VLVVSRSRTQHPPSAQSEIADGAPFARKISWLPEAFVPWSTKLDYNLKVQI
jgi:hypothetical protein